MPDTDVIGQFTTIVPPVPAEYDPVYLETVLNEIKSNINVMAQAVWLLTYGTAIGDRTSPGATAKTADYPIVATTDNGLRFSNLGATARVIFSLPAATTDVEFEFLKAASYDFELKPYSTNYFRLSAIGYLLQIVAVGDVVRIGCIEDGIWDVIRRIGTAPVYAGYLLLNEDGTPILTEDGNLIETDR